MAARRLLLVGGESAALLFAFAVLAAVSMRRDTEAARRRLTWFGARGWQLSLYTGTEAAAVAVAGTAAGWALGTLAGAAVASRAGAPVGEVLAHSTLSRTGLLAAAAVATALALVLLAALRARPLALGRRSFSAIDAAALGALAIVVLTLLRGDLDQEALAAESGTSVALVLLPGLVTFVAAVVCARLLRPALLLLERLSRGRSTSLRLAALSLARHPGHAAVAAAFLLVSVGLAVFAESYRSTLARGQEEQAAFAVPLDFTLREDLTRLIRVREAAPPEELAALGDDVQVEPVLRLAGNAGQRRPDGDHGARPRRGCDPGAGWLAQRLRVALPGGAGRTGRAGGGRRGEGAGAPGGRDGARAPRPGPARRAGGQRRDAAGRLRPARAGERRRPGRARPPRPGAGGSPGRPDRGVDDLAAGEGPGARRGGRAPRGRQPVPRPAHREDARRRRRARATTTGWPSTASRRRWSPAAAPF